MEKPDIRVVLGRGGSGKSTLARHWVDRIRKKPARIVVFDPNAEANYGDGAMIATTQAELVELLLPNPKRLLVCYRPAMVPGEGDYQRQRVAAFEACNEVAWVAENVWLVWEEVDKVSAAGHLPTFAGAIVDQGRHRDIRVIACARRPAKVPRDLTANASRIAAFLTTERNDLAYYADTLGAEAAASIAALAQYTALDWTEAGASVKKSPFE